MYDMCCDCHQMVEIIAKIVRIPNDGSDIIIFLSKDMSMHHVCQHNDTEIIS